MSEEQEKNYYAGRCRELDVQLQELAKRHRKLLGDARRAAITTELIRKLYRLDYLKLGADELAASFIEMAAKALGVTRAAIFRRCENEEGFECVRARGFVAAQGPLLAVRNLREGFICSNTFDADLKFLGEIRALTGARQFAWSYNRVSNLAVLFANGADDKPDQWRFCAEDAPMLAAVLDVVGAVIERAHVEQRLAHSAFHDSLTGLPNRGMMMRHLNACVQRGNRAATEIAAVLFIDIDRFKWVNDSLGHLAGDKLLVALAQRLRATVRPGDLVARLSGDEFAVLAEKLHTLKDAQRLAQRILDTLRTPLRIHGHSVYANVSIGIAEATPAHQSAADLLRDADIAMYHAKEQGGGRYAVFGNDMHGRALSQLRLETELREAIEKEELSLYYQPIFDLKTGEVEALEALLRWHHPREGLLEPRSFVSVMEQTGMLGGVGDWVLRRVARDINLWRNEARNLGRVQVCVNVAEGQFVQANFVATLSALMREHGIAADQLRLELTEGTLLDCKTIDTEVLEQLRQMGVKIMLDDFGTGYSSLSRLQKLPIDTIKIDQSFVTDLGTPEADDTIVRTIIAMARNLGMRIVAEGAERPAQLQALRDLGCDCVQGYLLGRPMAASKVSHFLRNQSVALGGVEMQP